MDINQTAQAVLQNQQVLGFTIPITGYLALDIFFITLFMALFMTLINKYLTDQIKIKALKKEMKDLQKEMRSIMSKNPSKAQALQSEIFKKNLEHMKQTMSPRVLLVTMLPVLVVFSFVRKIYGPYGEFLHLFGLTSFGWLGTYILFSIGCTLILKKVLDVA